MAPPTLPAASQGGARQARRWAGRERWREAAGQGSAGIGRWAISGLWAYLVHCTETVEENKGSCGVCHRLLRDGALGGPAASFARRGHCCSELGGPCNGAGALYVRGAAQQTSWCKEILLRA